MTRALYHYFSFNQLNWMNDNEVILTTWCFNDTNFIRVIMTLFDCGYFKILIMLKFYCWQGLCSD